MDVFTASAIALRRWYVVVPVLVLTGVLAFRQYTSATSTFSASASVVVLGPVITGQPGGASFLDPAIASVGGELVTSLALSNLTSNEVRSQVVTAGGSPVFTATASRDLPIFTIEASAASREDVEQTRAILLEQFEATLGDVQRDLGATTDGILRSQLSAPFGPPVEVPPETGRATVATVVGGTLLAVFGALLVEGLVAGRRRARHAGGTTDRFSSPSTDEDPPRVGLAHDR